MPEDNRAAKHFKDLNLSAYISWYDNDTLKYLVHSTSKAYPYLRYVFTYASRESFLQEFQQLVVLSNDLKQLALFICVEPGQVNISHFVVGVFYQGQLAIINPVGLTAHRDFYQLLQALHTQGLVNQFYISTTVIQRDPNGLMSCGPLCVELFRHFSQLSLQSVLVLFQSDRTQIKEGVKLGIIDISVLLPARLQPCLSLEGEAYQQYIETLRGQHLHLLEALTENEAENALNANEQIIMGQLVVGKKPILELLGKEAYQRLAKRGSLQDSRVQNNNNHATTLPFSTTHKSSQIPSEQNARVNQMTFSNDIEHVEHMYQGEIHIHLPAHSNGSDSSTAATQAESFLESIRSTLKQCYQAECWVERVLGEPMHIKDSFVHVGIVDEGGQVEKEERLRQRMQERYGILKTWEDIHQPKIDIPLPDLFKPTNRLHPRRYLVFGRAGIGKSTLCQRIAYLWSQEELWVEEKFDYLFWIPLRRININEFPPPPHGTVLTWKDIVQHLCLDQAIQLNSSEWHQLTTTKKILYLFDGYDETSYLEQAPYLKMLLNKVIKQAPYLILTSRPYQSNITHVDQTLEILGFNDEDINTYIDNNLPDLDKRKTLKPWLQKNPNIKGLSHIPLQLDLVCSLWQAEQSSNPFVTPLTNTVLYQKIIKLLFNRYFTRKGTDPNGLEHAEKKFVQNIMTLLGIIAAQAMRSESLLIRAEQIETILQSDPEFQDITLQDLHDVGLLKPTGKGHLNVRDSYFIHLTYEEFFMAYHLCHAGSNTIKQFVQNYRYHFRFQIVFKFLTGLLSSHGNAAKENTLIFFDALYQQPTDIVGFHHILLVAECLDECQQMESLCNTLNNQYNFLNNLEHWVSKAIAEQDEYKKTSDFETQIILLFTTSVQLFFNERILLLFVKWKDINQAIKKISQIKRAHPTILSFLEKCIADAHYKQSAIKAIYETGSPEAIPLFCVGIKDSDPVVRLYSSFALLKHDVGSINEWLDNLLIPFELPNDYHVNPFRDESELIVELLNKLLNINGNIERVLKAFLIALGFNLYNEAFWHIKEDMIHKKIKKVLITLSRGHPAKFVSVSTNLLKEYNGKLEHKWFVSHMLSTAIDILNEVNEIDENSRLLLLELGVKHANPHVQITSIRSHFKINKITNELVQAFFSHLNDRDNRNSLFNEELARTIEALGSNLSDEVFNTIFLEVVGATRWESLELRDYEDRDYEDRDFIEDISPALGQILKINSRVFNKFEGLLIHGTKEEQRVAVRALILGDPKSSIEVLMHKMDSSDPGTQELIISRLMSTGDLNDSLLRRMIAVLEQRNENLANNIALCFVRGLNAFVFKSLLNTLKEITVDNTSRLSSAKKITLDLAFIIELIKIMSLDTEYENIKKFLATFDLSPWLCKIEFHLINKTFTDFFRQEKFEYKCFLDTDWEIVLQGAPTRNLIQLYLELSDQIHHEAKFFLLLNHINARKLNEKVVITLDDQTLTVFDGACFRKIDLNSKQAIQRAGRLKKMLAAHQPNAASPSSILEIDRDPRDHLTLDNFDDCGTYFAIAYEYEVLGDYFAALKYGLLGRNLLSDKSTEKTAYFYHLSLHGMYHILLILDEGTRAAKQLEEAYEFIKGANQSKKRDSFFRESDIVFVASNLADVYLQIGDLPQAEYYIQKAFEASENKTLGPFANVYIQYAGILFAQNHYQRAYEQLTLAVVVLEKGAYDKNYLLCKIYLLCGKIYCAQFYNGVASQVFDIALNIALKVYSEHHVLVADCYVEMALLKKQLNEEDTAIFLANKAYEIYKSSLGENNSRTQKARSLSVEKKINTISSSQTERRVPHTFIFHSVDAKSVHIGGNFNNWLDTMDGKIDIQCHEDWKMKKNNDGVWEFTIRFLPGSYEFKYIVNGGEGWKIDPYYPLSVNYNSQLEIELTADQTSNTACNTESKLILSTSKETYRQLLSQFKKERTNPFSSSEEDLSLNVEDVCKAIEAWEFNEAIHRSLQGKLTHQEESLKELALSLGYKLYNVPGDGKCFFHAVLHQLQNGNLQTQYQSTTVQDLILQSVQYILDHQSEFNDFIKGDINTFIAGLMKGKEWADDVSITALSKALTINMVIINSDHSKPIVRICPDAQTTVYLGYEVEWHYQSLVRDFSLRLMLSLENYINSFDVLDMDESNDKENIEHSDFSQLEL